MSVSSAELQRAHGLIDFIQACPSMFHTAHTICTRLIEAGFELLHEGRPWNIEPGKRYVVVRNNSSVIAFSVGKHVLDDPLHTHFQITAAHGDSPTFKVKEVPELTGAGNALKLNVEAYGGMIDYTWFDKPLSLAGRVLVRVGNRLEHRLLSFDRDLALIPSVAIHLDRKVNDSFSPNRARDLSPVLSVGELSVGAYMQLVADAVGVAPEDVLGSDLFLVNRQPGCIWGAEQEFISSTKLDDLMCAYTALEAFMQVDNEHSVNVYCCFDNEEVGSETKQGALSTFIADAMRRVCAGLGLDDEAYRQVVARSMMVSCDNAHAVHPNRADVYDETNQCRINGGLVIKEAANQHYCTDGFSRAVFLVICDRAGVPLQSFANRSDMAGGSTLGNLVNMQMSLHAIDVGCAQWAMHSAFETAGVRDVSQAIGALAAFYAADLYIDGADAVTFGI
ncbi:M18 family aminopeptidase [Collinsella sp. zg1085]|uniref:M18 family aminopeptidase n=1 Tax=Collinsella sp. zg1085 TaxID=2844380 RepID=UPI001C0E2106|nr:M18 family aminopeptidase [Collinsella sp. zg1085]QWT17806.1 M18 family aminopeptidase [Collinsella sp. zg1085]